MEVSHSWLRKHWPKTGVCQCCGRDVGTARKGGGTHYAFLRHPEPHTRDRADYLELCPRCHQRMDRYARKVRSLGIKVVWRTKPMDPTVQRILDYLKENYS